jgi:pimeloyl-ACP methyl ester carboxylesterase
MCDDAFLGRKETMKHDNIERSPLRAALLLAAALTFGTTSVTQAADDDPPLNLARDGFFYAGGKPTTINGKTYIAGQMYVEFRIPAKQTHPYPIVMVHGGTRSGANWTGTVDGREGWAQYFARRGYAVYVVDQPGRGRSAYVPEVYGPPRLADAESAQQRYMQQEKFKLWPQAHLHTQWPGSGEIDDPATRQIIGSFLPEIAFDKSQPITHEAMLALADKIGPFIVLMHSQGGPIGWAIADARPDLVKAVVAVEPNGPPGRTVRYKGAPTWFEDGPNELSYGLAAIPITYSPAIKDGSELKWVREEKADGPDLVTCWKQAEPARQLTNLQKMPIVIVTSEASYHAPYDHCIVKFLQQAGVKPTWLKLADLGIKGNSHNMMQEKNSNEIAAVIHQWLEKALPAK